LRSGRVYTGRVPGATAIAGLRTRCHGRVIP